MKTAVIYARVSSREQAEGFSIDAQVKACKAKASQENFKVLKIFKDEGFTGTNRNRPALKALVDFCKNNSVHSVIIHKVDRFARSIVDHSAIRAMLIKHGTNLLSCSEQLGTAPHEVFLENIMASMAQYYSDNLKTEVKKGIVERFESGYHMSNPPFGYEVRAGSKVMQIIPREEKIIQKIFSLYVTGRYSFQTIADKIYVENNYKNRQGKKFSKSRIQDILSNVVYMGQIEYKKLGKKTQGLHKPIVTPTIFLLAQEIMETRGNVRKVEKGKFEFLYKGFVACPECGKTLYAAYSTGGSGKKHLYYCCRNRNHKAVNIKAKDINKAFLKTLESLRINDNVMDIVEEFVGKRLEEQRAVSGERLKECEKRVKAIEKEKLDVYKDYKKGFINEEGLKNVLSDLEDKQTLARVDLNEESIDYNDLLTHIRMLAQFGARIDRYWEIATFDQKRQILGSIFTNVPVFKNNEFTNGEISPLYKALQGVSEESVLCGRGNRT
ncbi:MAG TPA: recombinase family protein [Candidatus Dojkabacteria bacterium]|nr:recombinase family protein [Candidatus Dojkabacteria bacterium]